MFVGNSFYDLVLRLHEAATEPEGWGPVLAAISAYLKGRPVQLIQWDFAMGSGLVLARSDGPKGLIAQAAAGADLEYLRLKIGRGNMAAGQYRFVSKRCEEGDCFQCGWVEACPAAHGATHAAVICLQRSSDLGAFLCVRRSEGQGPFSRGEVRMLARLAPHAMISAKTAARWDEQRSALNRIQAALDQIGWGVVIADPSGRMLTANAVAREILDARDGLSLEAGRLSAWRPVDTRRVTDLLRRVTSVGSTWTQEIAEVVEVARPSVRRPLALIVAPLSHASDRRLGADTPSALVFITDPESDGPSPASLLRELYDLTTAEARVASSLAAGLTVSQIARTHSKSVNTVRVQVRALLAKTGTCRQSEFIRLLSRLPTMNGAGRPQL